MSISKVEFRMFAGPAQVNLGGLDKPTIIEMRFGPKGDDGATGATGATGPAGPNTVTSATASDGTANLSLSNVSTSTATVSGLLTAGHIHGNLAGTLYTHVRTGEAMSKGDPFYISGFHVGSSQPIAMRADASDPLKMPAVGVMDADYANNTSSANGIISGTLSSIDTAGYAVNSPVYVANGGGYSNVAGTIPQQVGITERANISTGAFIVTSNKVINSADISDASTLPVYNETTELFDEVAVLFDENGSINANSFLAGVDGFYASNADDFASFSMSASPINFKIGTKQFRFNQPVGNGGQYTVPDGSGTLALTSNASGSIVSSDISDATTTGEANKLVKVNAGGNLVCDILFANSSLDVGSEGNQSGIINVVNSSGDVGRITNENEANGVELRFPTAGTGTQHQIVVTSDLNGRADKVHDGTISGTTTINSTSYTYGTGAAAAHRDALGVAGKQSKTTSTAITSTNGTPTDVTDLTGFTLEANATYRLTVWSLISTASGGSFEYIFECSGTTYLGGTAQAGSGVFRSGGVLGGGYHYTNLRFSPLYATQNLTSGHTYGEYYFRTAGTAGTAKMLFSQRSSAVAGTTTVAAGATVILERIS